MSNHSGKVSVSVRSRAVKSPLSLPARLGVLLLGLMLSSLTLIAFASAATITVGNAGDPATGNAARCNAANTCTLRDAIAKAAAVTGTAAGDTIVFSLPANSTITLSGRELLVDRNLIIDGSGSANLAISGNNASRAFEISTGVVATLKQLVIKNGNNSDNGGGIYNSGALTLVGSTVSGNTGGIGGGISSNDGAALTLTNSTVSGNMAYIAGGIANHSGSLTLTNSSIVNNTARSSGGGGILNTSGRLTLTNSTVANNTAISGGGIENMSGPLVLTGSTISGNSPGGIANYYGIASLTDSVISSNTAPRDAGGIYNKGIMTLTRCTIAGNTAIISDFYGHGGGIYNWGTLTLASSTVWGNAVSGSATTSGSGGGIYNSDGASLTLTDSTISDNRAGGDYGSGGGVASGGGLTLTNTTVSGNTTGSHGVGGGIAGSSLTLVNSTVSGNTAGSHGGGIYTAGSTLIHGTIANNTAAGRSSDIYNHNLNHLSSISAVDTIIQNCEVDGIDTRALVDNGGNLDGGNGCGFTDASSKSNASLNLGALVANGGPTLTMMPGANSDALGSGLPYVCRSAPVNSRDQRGYVRPASGCSSGAVDPDALANESIFFGGFGFGGQ